MTKKQQELHRLPDKLSIKRPIKLTEMNTHTAKLIQVMGK